MNNMDEYKVFKVKYGSIYNNNGIMINNMGVIVDKDAGLIKYGDVNKGIKECYTNMVDKYLKCGFEDMANDLVYIEFNRYDSILSIEEICTLCNYMVMCSGTGSRLYKLLSMDEDDIKKEIKKLRDLGY